MTQNTSQSPDTQPTPSRESPALQELRRHLAEPGPWAQRFRRLAKAIADVPNLSCEDCEKLLDLYVDDELQGGDVEQRYPMISQHLQRCPRCQESHDLLLEILELERRDGLPLPPEQIAPRPPFPSFQPQDTAGGKAEAKSWYARLRPRTGGAPFGLLVVFSPAYLQGLLPSPSPAPISRDESSSPVTTHLLLSDTIRVGDEMLAVEVTAEHNIEAPNRLCLKAAIAGLKALPKELQATLTWSDQTYTELVNADGQVQFGEVLLTTLQDALDKETGDFRITFEARA